VRAGAYTPAVETNLLYYGDGDNLDVLRRHVKDESVDLVYLDPPFNSNATYNLLFEEHGEKAAAQVQAFTDTWEWNTDARQAYEEIVEAGGKVADTMRAFWTMLGPVDMLAYPVDVGSPLGFSASRLPAARERRRGTRRCSRSRTPQVQRRSARGPAVLG
jgi:hypothetical protein